jgi:hypothetical protein
MKDDSSKWLKGCGIGCAVIAIIVIAGSIGSYYYIKTKIQNFKQAEHSLQVLEETLGQVDQYCPEADGKIKPERIKIFLSIRDTTENLRNQLTQTVEQINKFVDKEPKAFKNVMAIFQQSSKALPQLAYYLKFRNELMIEHNLGLGEYYYIYVISYFSWLKKSPEDGPDFRLPKIEEKDSTNSVNVNYKDVGEDKDYWSGDKVKQDRRNYTMKRINKIFLTMLHCQLNELKKSASISKEKDWSIRLQQEIEFLKADVNHVPWSGGLPQALEKSLEPFREQLEKSYHAILNPMEINPISEK